MEKCDINKHFGNYISNFNDMEDIDSFYCPSIRGRLPSPLLQKIHISE